MKIDKVKLARTKSTVRSKFDTRKGRYMSLYELAEKQGMEKALKYASKCWKLDAESETSNWVEWEDMWEHYTYYVVSTEYVDEFRTSWGTHLTGVAAEPRQPSQQARQPGPPQQPRQPGPPEQPRQPGPPEQQSAKAPLITPLPRPNAGGLETPVEGEGSKPEGAPLRNDSKGNGEDAGASKRQKTEVPLGVRKAANLKIVYLDAISKANSSCRLSCLMRVGSPSTTRNRSETLRP